MIKIAHITSTHAFDDPRIFHRHCLSLSRSGYSTYFTNVKKAFYKNFNLVTIPPNRNRFSRFTINNFYLLKKIQNIKPQIIEYHDPDLLFLAILLKLLGYKVIANIHENLSDQILNKYWIPKYIRVLLSYFLKLLFPFLTDLFSDGRVCATDYIKKFHKNKNTISTLNFPTIDFLQEKENSKRSNKKLSVIYVGVLEKKRGIDYWDNFLKLERVSEIHLVGKFSPTELEEQYRSKFNNIERVHIYGQRNYSEIKKYIDQCDIGICLIESNQAYYNSLPTKIFEYLARHKPVITNRFPELVKVLENKNCCVFIEDVERELQMAIENIFHNYDYFSKNARIASHDLNWMSQEKKYLKLINEIV